MRTKSQPLRLRMSMGIRWCAYARQLIVSGVHIGPAPTRSTAARLRDRVVCPVLVAIAVWRQGAAVFDLILAPAGRGPVIGDGLGDLEIVGLDTVGVVDRKLGEIAKLDLEVQEAADDAHRVDSDGERAALEAVGASLQELRDCRGVVPTAIWDRG